MTITSQDMTRPPASSARDIIRGSSPALLKTLGWAGIALSWITTIARAMKADASLHHNAAGYVAWYGFGVGLLGCLLISWGQWAWTPFGRRRVDLEERGWRRVHRLTMLVGYVDAQGGYHPVYSWGMFTGYLIVLLPDVLISLYEVASVVLLPFLSPDWRYPWVVASLAILGIITAMASIGPENVIFKK